MRQLFYGLIVCACAAGAWALKASQTKTDVEDSSACTTECTCCYESSSSSDWVVVEDSCKKCVMNDTTRKCGKCGGFMNSVDGTATVEGQYIKSTYKCKKCGHTIIYKNK